MSAARINKLAVSGIMVSYTDLEHWADEAGGYPGHVVSVSAIKAFDEALDEVMVFVRQVQSRPQGQIHRIRLLSELATEIDLPVPEPLPPMDADMTRFVVAWEDRDHRPGKMGGPLRFFELTEHRTTPEQVRTAAVDFMGLLRVNGHQVLYMDGYDGQKWHRLNEQGLLPRLRINPFRRLR